jgi:acetyl esterase/lipase
MPYVKLKMPENAAGFVMPILDVDHITRKWLDVDYTPDKPHPMRKLDIYLPEEGDGPFPTIIAIHGGAFWGGAKNDLQVAAYMEAIPYGFAVASVEQRLCSMLPGGGYSREGIFPNPVFDFKAAIRFLRANAASYKLDPERFIVAGGSAGGYHAVMAAASADCEALYDPSLGFADVSGEVSAVIDWFGVGDLVVQSEFTAKSPALKLPDGSEFKMDNYADIFLGVSATANPNLAYFASPETWITSKMPPTLIQCGAADEVVPVECSRRIAAKIKAVCGKDRVTYEEFEGYTHGDMRFNSEDNIRHMIEWLQKTLNK